MRKILFIEQFYASWYTVYLFSHSDNTDPGPWMSPWPSTPDLNAWVFIRLQQSLMTSSSFKSGGLVQRQGDLEDRDWKSLRKAFFPRWFVHVWECNVCLRCCKSPQMLPSFTVWLHSISNSSQIPWPCASIQVNKILFLWLIALFNYTFNTLFWRHFFRYKLMPGITQITLFCMLLWLSTICYCVWLCVCVCVCVYVCVFVCGRTSVFFFLWECQTLFTVDFCHFRAHTI